jgi:hypothetical protein
MQFSKPGIYHIQVLGNVREELWDYFEAEIELVSGEKNEQIVSDDLLKSIQDLGNHKAYKGSTEEQYGSDWFGEVPEKNTAQWDHYFPDGGMFKHGNMGQGIYVDPKRDFCGIYFGLAPNPDQISGIDHSPGYLRAAAKMLAGK